MAGSGATGAALPVALVTGGDRRHWGGHLQRAGRRRVSHRGRLPPLGRRRPRALVGAAAGHGSLRAGGAGDRQRRAERAGGANCAALPALRRAGECAGTTRFVPHADLERLDDALFDAIFAVNVRGAFAAVRALKPLLERSQLPGGGVVVNISSIAARHRHGQQRHLLRLQGRARQHDAARWPVRWRRASAWCRCRRGWWIREFVKSLDQAWRDEQAARTPLRRLALPAEVASAVVAAVTQLTFTTGAVIAVDGGRPLS